MPRKPTTPRLSVVAPGTAPEHPDPPGKLGETGLALWRSVVENYAFGDPGSIEILFQACRSADRAEACREIIDTDGEMIRTKAGMRSHPLLRDELDNRALCGLLGKLGLDLNRSALTGRPPGR